MPKSHKFNLLVALAAAGLLSVPVIAQTPTQAANSAQAPAATVGQRKENQQDRIAQGVKSGQLTAGETKNLENREAGLNAETRSMRAGDDGHLTAGDRAQLNRQQNRLSRNIYTDKHNAAVQRDGSGRIGQRDENQQDRIAQGIKSGRLNAGQTARLEGQQQQTNRDVNAMRKANGGKLTAGERASVNKRQNKTSRNIYKAKH